MSIRDDKEVKAEQMGSEGWSVFAGYKMIASNLTKEDAHLVVNALKKRNNHNGLRNALLDVAEIAGDALGADSCLSREDTRKVMEICEKALEKAGQYHDFDFENQKRLMDMPDVYYQPDPLPDDLPSFGVFLSKEEAERRYPDCEIVEYHGDAIEEPIFVDGPLFLKLNEIEG